MPPRSRTPTQRSATARTSAGRTATAAAPPRVQLPPRTAPVVTRPLRARVAELAPVVVAVAGIACAVLGILVLGIVLVVVAIVVGVGNFLVGSPRRILETLHGRIETAAEQPRLFNILEGLCLANGLSVPELRVLDDPAPNALVLARGTGDYVLVVTTGLLDLLDRIELEGLLAHELAHLKRGDVLDAARASIALGCVGLVTAKATTGCLLLGHREREVLADRAGVEMTRYPPGLVAALAKIADASTSRPRGLSAPVARLTGAFWCSPLSEASAAKVRAGVFDLELRIAALAEL